MLLPNSSRAYEVGGTRIRAGSGVNWDPAKTASASRGDLTGDDGSVLADANEESTISACGEMHAHEVEPLSHCAGAHPRGSGSRDRRRRSASTPRPL